MIPDKYRIASLWKQFHQTALHNIAPNTVQYSEMQKAFYAGVWIAVRSLQDAALQLPEATQIEILKAFEADFIAYKNQLLNEHVNRRN
ncbi:MAG TPA: hypothetical protein VD994_17030 [Prosthecobacter sp.]|nr:hypothetical protein [Prosthecobacter sp.]